MSDVSPGNDREVNKKNTQKLPRDKKVLDSISLRSLFNEAVEPHILFSLDGSIITVNQACSLYLGIPVENTETYNIYDFLFDDESRQLKRTLKDILEVRTGILEVRFKAPDIGLLSGEMVYQVVESNIGSVIYARIRDLQVLRSLNRLLEEKEVSFRGAERLANLGFWSFYPSEGRIVWSEEIFNIFGIEDTNCEPSFEEFLSLVHPNDVEKFSEIVQNAIQNHQGYVVKHRLLRPDGTVRWVSGRGDVLVDEEGILEKVFGTVQDITEEEEIREAIRRSEQRIRFHLDSSPLGYIEWNNKFEIVEWNKAAEKIFGFSKEDALEGNADIIPREDDEKIQAVVDDLLNDRGGTHSINNNMTKSGHVIVGEWFNTTLKAENGDILGIGSIVQDITDRIEAKKRLEDYAHDLEAARDEAENAAQAKSEFLANMSHEIRTPMNGVIGMASILLDTDLDEEQQDYVETIVHSGESLLAIINDILDFSKIDAGKIDFESLPFDIRETIENTFDLLASKASEKKLELVHFIGRDVPEVVIGDPTRLQQILLNLIGNAIKFTSEGHVEVRVRLEPIDSSCLRLAFDIEDTGIGIAQDKLNRLFKAFSQVDASTSRKYGGTGLGLSISAQLAQLMGGDISVQSTEGVGSIFTFSVSVEMAALQTKTDKNLEGLHVLLIEPHQRLREMIASLLNHLNCTCTILEDNEEIHQLIRSQISIDVILMDVALEEKDGAELAAKFEAMDQEMPEIVLVSWSIDRTVHDYITEQISKPVHLKNLYRILKKVSVLQK